MRKFPASRRPDKPVISLSVLGLSVMLLASSCGNQTSPQAAANPSPSSNQAALTPQSNKIEVKTALPGVLFLPPTVQNPGQTGPLQENARVNIEIFKLDGTTVTSGDVGPRLSTKDGSISQNGGHYQANWNTSDSKLPDGSSIRIELRLDNAPDGQAACNAGADVDAGCLAYIDAKLWSNQGEANKNGAKSDTTILNLVNGRTLPIKFHINTGAVNATPKVKILTPASGVSLNLGDSLNLTGSANDFEDGDLTKTIDWNIDGIGSVGTGASAQKALPVGSYTVTASVKDSQGAVGKAQIQVTVINPITLTAITPPIGSTLGGNEVTLTGIGFTGVTDVKFGDVSATSFKVVDDHTIKATAPANDKPVGIKVKVVNDKASSNMVDYTYRIPYRISALARPLTASIYQYFDDRLIVKLNDLTIADMAGENLAPGNYPPRILKDFAANDGDKLTFAVVNRWPWACGSGEITLIKPDGSTGSAYPGFVDSNCSDRIGEVARYEYTLPNGPGKSLPIQAPDITDVAITPAAAGTPTTFTWKLANPANAALNCFIDFGDGQNQTLDTCTVNGSTQHTYNSAGNYSVKFKVADGPYASGNSYDPKSGDSNSFQKFYSVKVDAATAPVNPNNPTNPSNPTDLSISNIISDATIKTFSAYNISWDLENADASSSNCKVDFGDGEVSVFSHCSKDNKLQHYYTVPGNYVVTISGNNGIKNIDAHIAVSVTQSDANNYKLIWNDSQELSYPKDIIEKSSIFTMTGYKIVKMAGYKEVNGNGYNLEILTDDITSNSITFLIASINDDRLTSLTRVVYMKDDSIVLTNLENDKSLSIENASQYKNINKSNELAQRIKNIYSSDYYADAVEKATQPLYAYPENITAQKNVSRTFVSQNIVTPIYCRDCSAVFNSYSSLNSAAANERSVINSITLVGVIGTALGAIVLVPSIVAESTTMILIVNVAGDFGTLLSVGSILGTFMGPQESDVEDMEKRAKVLHDNWLMCQDPQQALKPGYQAVTIATAQFYGGGYSLFDGLYGTQIGGSEKDPKDLLTNPYLIRQTEGAFKMLSGFELLGATTRGGTSLNNFVDVPNTQCQK